ncbi:Nesprin-1, partial [Trichoplax sp. H2]
MPRETGRLRINHMFNCSKVLGYLQKQKIKISVTRNDVPDGKVDAILSLVWNIILYFQIEGHSIERYTTKTKIESQVVDSNSLRGSTTQLNQIEPAEQPKAPIFKKGTGKKALLLWCQAATTKSLPGSSLGVITNFTTDWINGYAFMFIVHSLRPNLVNLEQDIGDDNKKNLDKAFTLLEEHLNVPRLLEPSDVDVEQPDEKSILTYIACIYRRYPELPNLATMIADEDLIDDQK